MQYSVLRKSELFYQHPNFRLDSEYYKPNILSMLDMIQGKNHNRISEIADVTDGEHGSPKLDKNSGIAYLSGQNVKENLIDFRNIRYCTKELHEKNLRSALKYGNILVSIVGTVGNSAVVSQDILANTDRNVATIKNLSNEYNPFYLSTFLNSKYGKEQVKRGCAGNVQPIINLTELKLVKIPLLSNKFQFFVEKIIKKSYLLSGQSESLYSSAENLLLEELGLKDWKPKHQLSYIKNYSDTQKAERFDAEYFQPQYDEVIERIKNYQGGFDYAKNLISLNNKNYKPKDDKDYRYVELSNISQNGEVKGFIVAKGQDLPTRARRKINNQDLLLSSIEGSLDSISLIKSNYDNMLCSTGFFVASSKSINPETMLIFFKSLVGQIQLKKGCSGTILTAISSDELNKMLIPNINQEIQDKIENKINKVYLFKSQSKSLLEIAKKAVEMAIEISEEQASNWIDQEL